MRKLFYVILTVVILLFALAGCVGQSYPGANGGVNGSVNENPADLFEFTLDETADGYCIISADTSISGEVVVPDMYNDKPVIRIAERAFYNCKDISGVVLPDSITNIGASAFRSCSNLVSVELPENISQIGSDCFHGCVSLKNIDIPAGVLRIAERAFYECESLETISLSGGLLRIDSSAFRHGILGRQAQAQQKGLTCHRGRGSKAQSRERATRRTAANQRSRPKRCI